MTRTTSAARAVLGASAAVLLLLLGLVAAPAAQAHTELVSSTPANGAALDAPPKTISLTFDEEPASVEFVKAESTDGASITLDSPTLAGTVLTVAWPADAAPGLYRLGWSLISDDGDPVTGTIMFSYVAAAAAPSATAPSSAAPEPSQSVAQSAAPVATTTSGSSTGTLVAVGLGALVLLVVAGTTVAVLRRSRRDDRTDDAVVGADEVTEPVGR